jgi:hypothetical protein
MNFSGLQIIKFLIIQFLDLLNMSQNSPQDFILKYLNVCPSHIERQGQSFTPTESTVNLVSNWIICLTILHKTECYYLNLSFMYL